MTQPWRRSLYDYILTQAQPPEKFGHQPRLHALTQQISAPKCSTTTPASEGVPNNRHAC